MCKEGTETIQWLDGRADDLSAVFAVRLAVFCEEQGYAPDREFDSTDREALHILVSEEGKPIGTGRLYWLDTATMALGRIAVLQTARGRGIGARIVRAMLRKAAACGAASAQLDAQCRAIGFYEKQGFTVCGEEHMDGHVPHRRMTCDLRSRTNNCGKCAWSD